MKKLLLIVVVIAAAVGIYLYKAQQAKQAELDAVLVSGNGRIEATEISISTKLAGRIDDILVNEGDYVKKGQPLVQLQTSQLDAKIAQARAQRNKAITASASAQALISIRESEIIAAQADVKQKETSLNVKKKKYERSLALHKKSVISDQEMDDDEAAYQTAISELESAKANLARARANVESAKADAFGAKANVSACEADIAVIQSDLDECVLTAPREGRIQYSIAQVGETLAAGGRVLNLVDLTDVYMTFFVPETIAGKIEIGTDVRIVLDAMPDVPVPAKVSFVASVAQFTPKTVETKAERQKFMFRVKARIAPELLKQYIDLVKTGLPGVAWLKLDSEMEWPENLKLAPETAAASQATPTTAPATETDSKAAVPATETDVKAASAAKAEN